MSKLSKLIQNPGVFFRDFLIKKYPYVNNEQGCTESEELAILKHTSLLEIDYLNKSESNTIDIVYTWVNRNNQWLEEYQFYSSRIDPNKIGKHANDSARFEDHNELYYSLKSVRKNLPWVRNIFVVTNNFLELPEYLIDDQIILVEHSSIIDSKYLPTFNSHVIEACLHKIEGLSENFIYFNDDVFAAQSLASEHFFQSNGLASLFVSQKKLDDMYAKGIHTPTLLASLHSRNLLYDSFGCHVNTPLVHTYVPLKKSMYELAWQLYGFEITSFLSNRFRGNQDLNMATFLVPWLMYVKGFASIESDICYYFNIRSPHAIQQYQKLLYKPDSDKPHSICANDFHSNHVLNKDYKHELFDFLENFF